MKKFLKIMFISIIGIIVALTITVLIFIRQTKFGRIPSGERLVLVQQSPNYKDGSFQNLSPTPDLTEGVSYYAVLKEFFFADKKRSKPIDTIPSQETDLFELPLEENVLVWFGHSSYFIQVDGKKILVDPVFSGSASPLSFTTPSFMGADVYTVSNIPDIDYLFISHDHWDHVDYETLMALKPKVKKIFCGLGTGEHFEYWGFDKNTIIEKDWNETIPLGEGFTVHTTPARHFSGRAFQRNKALWTSFVLETPTQKIYIGGDSGYDTHFKTIGDKFGPFDLAVLENGQYDKSWKYIHMMPYEVLQAANDLKARNLFPVHSSKFTLANHDWDHPLKTITSLNQEENLHLVTPVIGEPVNLNDSTKVFEYWWESIR